MGENSKPPVKRRVVTVKVTPARTKSAAADQAAATAKSGELRSTVSGVARKLAEKLPPRVEAKGEKPPAQTTKRVRAATALPSRQRAARYGLGDVVKHRVYGFRGVVFDIDPVFANTEEWWSSIPEDIRPKKDQPYYHLLAENTETEYIAYVSEQNLVPDTSGKPLRHPQVKELFKTGRDGVLRPVFLERH
jgi:heat shock protein HspQ